MGWYYDPLNYLQVGNFVDIGLCVSQRCHANSTYFFLIWPQIFVPKQLKYKFEAQKQISRTTEIRSITLR
jgi:hypothetical protein